MQKAYRNGERMRIFYQPIETEMGIIHIAADDSSLLAVSYGSNHWEQYCRQRGEIVHEGNDITRATTQQLQEYQEGKRRNFELPITFEGTDFQKRAWQGLLTIPYGETRSYSEQAALIGSPKAVRAVGSANGKNPIAIIVPCHRVISKSGNIGGYAGGVEVKKYLLRLEEKYKP